MKAATALIQAASLLLRSIGARHSAATRKRGKARLTQNALAPARTSQISDETPPGSGSKSRARRRAAPAPSDEPNDGAVGAVIVPHACSPRSKPDLRTTSNIRRTDIGAGLVSLRETSAAEEDPMTEGPQSLAGQKALVTGANSGIGEAVAIALGEAGADVVVNYVTGEDRAEAVCEEIRRRGAGFRAQGRCLGGRPGAGDVPHVPSPSSAPSTFSSTMPGCSAMRRFTTMTLAQWNTVIGVNLTGQFLCAREAIREFLRRGVVEAVSCAAGKIVCISSVHEIIPWAGHANYAASKGGVLMMMKTLAQEVAPQRIRVNSVAPGRCARRSTRAAWNTPEAYRKLMSLVPYKRIGEPDGHRAGGRVARFRPIRLRRRRDACSSMAG